MASPCEVLVDGDDCAEAQTIVQIVADVAHRIEKKYSRYRDDNVVHSINAGERVEVDGETARLLHFADQLFRISEGKFDITSGVLREAWTFDGSDRIPSDEQVARALDRVGWSRVHWDGRSLQLGPDMQIDLGGIGKEYAVDLAGQRVSEVHRASALINFGGDLVVTRPRRDLQPWHVGIEHVDPTAHAVPVAARLIDIQSGGLATSGDTRRYLLRDGVRLGHILDPTTGWPVVDAARSITVAAGTCTQAGMLSTLAMLQGAGAEAFLDVEDVRSWVLR